MAKISARGAREVAAVNASAEATNALGTEPARRITVRFVLRSDRVILRRFRGSSATGYSVFGKVKPTTELSHTSLARIVSSLGYTVES